MNLNDIKNILRNLHINIDEIISPQIKAIVIKLQNLIESLSKDNQKLKDENQKLKDEINLLKGEQAKPEFKPKKLKNISSESERNKTANKDSQKKSRNRDSKKDKIKIDRKEECTVNKTLLPEDAVFKYYERVIIQDIKISTDNVEFTKEVYYSPSMKKTYKGDLPPGYKGEYGPGIKSLIVIMKGNCNMSEPKILDFLTYHNVKISASTISAMLIKDNVEIFHQEKEEIYQAGIESTEHQQIDDTTSNVNGKKYYTHVVCNDFYTAFFTEKKKNRLTILDILRQFKVRTFCFNDETFNLLQKLKVSKKNINELMKIDRVKDLTETELNKLLDENLPTIGNITRTRILEAAAIAAYHKERGSPIIKNLICDDAPQFKLLTEGLGLCWVHDGRHYKKLRPIVPLHEEKVKEFLTTYWNFYHELIKYKENPSEKLAHELSEEFDEIFSTETGYEDLDERIKKTKQKKEELLLVLQHPEVPLHNNASELGARVVKRMQDVSLQLKTDEGVKARDSLMTVMETAKKLAINTYDYIYDRISKAFKLPSLASIIKEKSN